MATTRWTLVINNQTHTVCLKHGYWGGKREIYVDENPVEHSRKLFDSGSVHSLLIDGQPIHLYITSSGAKFNYLLINGLEIIPSDRDLRAGRSAEKLLYGKHFWDLLIWRELSERLELPYSVDARMPWHYRHRLIGMCGGYLVTITPGYLQELLQDGFSVTVRYASLKTSEQVEQIAKEERITALLGRLDKQMKVVFDVQEKYTSIFLPFKHKETPANIASKIQQFIAVIGSHVPVLANNHCETINCRSRGTSPLRLGLIDNIPYFLCQNCLDDLPECRKRDDEVFQQTPSNLLPGLLAGAAAALLGSALLAGIGLFFIPAFGLLLSSQIMPVMVYLMGRVKVKASWSMLLMSAGLTILTILLGHLLMTFSFLVRSGFPIAVDTVVEARQVLLQDPFLKINLFIASLVAASYFLRLWFSLRASASQQVEILSFALSTQATVKKSQ